MQKRNSKVPFNQFKLVAIYKRFKCKFQRSKSAYADERRLKSEFHRSQVRNGSEESETSRSNVEESYVCRYATKTNTRNSEKVEVGLEGPRGLCCTAAPIWYTCNCDRCLEKYS